MNVTLTSTYDGYTSGATIACSLYEGRILIARGLASQHVRADLTTGFKQGSNKRSQNPVTIK